VLRCYVTRRSYQTALAAGGPRYALDGSPAGEVTEEQARSAALVVKIIDTKMVEAATAMKEARREERSLARLRDVLEGREPAKVWPVSLAHDHAPCAASGSQKAPKVQAKPDSTNITTVIKAEKPPVATSPAPQRPGLKAAARERKAAEVRV
jgi:sRNA-binding protein